MHMFVVRQPRPNLPAITGLVIPQEGACHGVATAFGARSQEKDVSSPSLAVSGELDLATAPILTDNLAPFEGNGVSTSSSISRT